MLNAEYDRYIHSQEWRSKANQRLVIDGHVCQACGGEATEVHHLTYERFKNEDMSDLVSLCRRCHQKAEDIYDPSITPWAMEEVKPEGNNFMAAMRVDAARIAPIVFEWLKGDGDFQSLMRLRQPIDPEGKQYWGVLRRAVEALCRKRYSMNCAEDRRCMMVNTIGNHVTVICLQTIEHAVRNNVQAVLHREVLVAHDESNTWQEVASTLGISKGTLRKLRTDDGSSFGPSLREAVLYYCGMDAAAGIPPAPGFTCLTDGDYEHLNCMATYVGAVSGTGLFRGEG